MTPTDHLRRCLDAGEPDAPLLIALAELIRARIRESGMWEQPPEYLGYPEYHSWTEAYSGGEPWPATATDFYMEEVKPDLDFFEQTIRAGTSVDALLWQKVSFFLIDRQKRNDPIGYRTFKNLVAVIEAMVAEGAATVTGRVKGKIRNPTLVRLTREDAALPVAERDLARVLDSDAAWQPVLRRLGKLGEGAQRLLRERLDGFPAAGVAAFLVGELATVLKARTRPAHETWSRPADAGGTPPAGDPDNAEVFRTGEQGERYIIAKARLAALAQSVRESVVRSNYTPKVQRAMLTVLADWLKYLALGQDPPPLREWAAELGLPKSSLADYVQRLRLLFRAIMGQQQAN